ncbi:MAG: AtpZ/AtpI family protein [Kiritimatiellae bacterium]|nr:AtpZ/AtpI family protein [Kiritimatiellia bacterium]MDD5520784.1 AtpZ/AtpI family protein [Kiritimatiellia bacterium]
MRKASQAIALGSNLAVGMGLFTFLGYYVDHKRGGGFFWTMCGMGLGLLYGAYEIWKVIRVLSSNNDNNQNQNDLIKK